MRFCSYSIAYKWLLFRKVLQMKDQELLKRLSIDPKIMLGKPVVKGTRLTVEYVIDRLAHGATASDLMNEYDGLTCDDVSACLLFAKQSLSETDYLPLAEAS
jgi:uncharacterized protein (DUF433 family)